MKRPRRSVSISLFVALAVACAFVVAIAGCSGSNDRASTSALEGLDAARAKDDSLKTLNVGSDLYPRLCIPTSTVISLAWMSRY